MREIAIKSAHSGFWLSLGACFLIRILAAFALPLVVSYDGHLYYKQAFLFGTDRFWAEFDFLRTPLFPLLARAAMEALGRQPEAIVCLNLLFSLGTLLLSALIARSVSGDIAGIGAALLLTLYPVSYAYQQSFLTEAGSSFFLTLIVFTLLKALRFRSPPALVAHGAALLGAYYFRPTFIYLAPLSTLLLLWPSSDAPAQPLRRRAFAAVLLLVIVWSASLPWQQLTNKSGRKNEMLVWGLINQAVLPEEESDLLGTGAAAYKQAISRLDSGVPLSGLPDEAVQQTFYGVPPSLMQTAPAFFRQSILKHPLRYLSGVLRTLSYFTGFASSESENDLFVRFVSSSTQSYVLPGPPDLSEEVSRQFSLQPRESLFAHAIAFLNPWFRFLILASNFALLLGLGLGLLRKDLRLIALGLLVFGFYGLHAMILFSIDRYAFPAYPIAFVAFACLPALVRNPKSCANHTSFKPHTVVS